MPFQPDRFPAAMRMARRFALVIGLVVFGAAVPACDGGFTGVGSQGFQCVGLPATACERILEQARQDLGGLPVVSATIRCTIPVCTEANGEAQVEVVFSDGQRSSYGTGWAQARNGGVAPAPQPAEPVPESPPPSSGG